MRFCLVLALGCGLAATARAQSGGSGGTGGGTAGLGSCSGQITGSVGLAIPDGSGNFTTVQPASVGYVYNYAECACTPPVDDQVNLEIKLTTALGHGPAGNVQVWVGSGCDNYTTRTATNNTACQQINVPINITDFSLDSTASTSGIHIPIPGNALSSPVLHECTSSVLSNQIYVFLYTDITNPFATCTLSPSEDNQGPEPAVKPGATTGDSAVHLNWTSPAVGSLYPINYQILCADDAGNPVPQSSTHTPLYSTCVDGVLERRPVPSGGSLSTGTDDAGTSTADLGFSRLPAGGANPDYVPPLIVDGGTGDGGVGDGGAFDMTPAAGDMAVNPITFPALKTLDKKFICSDQIAPTATGATIGNLQNYQKYHFVILSIDQFGNATPAADVSATPLPVEDFYRRYRGAGGAPGGCFIATAAFGSYESRWVYVLRDFRDDVLLPTTLGRDLVDWYYAHSPRYADWIARHAVARFVTRVLLVPVIVVAGAWVYSAPWQKALLMLAILIWLCRRRLTAAWNGGRA
jgi:hypothetical protein